MASRWRWPPERLRARSPIWVSRPCGRAARKRLGLGGADRGLDLVQRRVLAAEADVLQRRAGEQRRFLRHQRHAGADLDRIGLAHVDPVQQHPAGLRIVEAQQQAEDRALAGARRADQRHPLAGLHGQRQAVQRRHVRRGPDRRRSRSPAPPRRAAGSASAIGMRGRGDAGPRGQQLGDPLHGAGGLLHVAPALAQRAHRARRHHRQQGELDEGAPGQLAR